VQFIPIRGLPLVKRGDDLGELIVRAAEKQGLKIERGDVVVVAQSVVSKAEGNVVDLRRVRPSRLASEVAAKLNKDPREVEVILQQSSEIVRLAHVIISRTRHGFVCANAGVDHSNAGPNHVTILPDDPDASAARIRKVVKRRLKVDVAVIVTDTQGRPFRRGCVGVALGVAGMNPLLDLRGKKDLYGKELRVTITSPADAIAAAAVAVMGEADEGTPVVLVKGAMYKRGDGTARELVRSPERDLFR
jgi:coenzyme F420-0:L-glutamate ligase/coenzyme F420-1:gamma-L-glutamate ligase